MNRPVQPMLPSIGAPYVRCDLDPWVLADFEQHVVFSSSLSRRAKLVWWARSTYARKNNLVTVCNDTLARALACTPRSIQLATAELVRARLHKRAGPLKGARGHAVQIFAFPFAEERSEERSPLTEALAQPEGQTAPVAAIAAADVDGGVILASPEQARGDPGITPGVILASPELRSGIELDPPPPSSTDEEEENSLRSPEARKAELDALYQRCAHDLKHHWPSVDDAERELELRDCGQGKRTVDGRKFEEHFLDRGPLAFEKWARDRLKERARRGTSRSSMDRPATEQERRAARERQAVKLPTAAELAAWDAEAAEVGGLDLVRNRVRGAA